MTEKKHGLTPKEFLSLAWGIDRRIELKIEERERLESRVTSGRMSNLSGMPRGGKYDWTDTVSNIMRVTEQINDEIQRLCYVKRLVIEAIEAVEDVKYRTLLELRYRHYMTWEAIADELTYDVRYVYKLHGEALLCVKVPREFA